MAINKTPASRELNNVNPGRPDPTAAIAKPPDTTSLAGKLQDPKIRGKMEEILGRELVDKLDKIFNPGTMPGAAELNMRKQMLDELKQRMHPQAPGGGGPTGV